VQPSRGLHPSGEGEKTESGGEIRKEQNPD